MKSLIIIALIFASFQAGIAQKTCEAGEFYNPNSKYKDLCDYCPKGTWSNGTVPITECEACAAGSIAPKEGYKWCTVCDEGTYEKDRLSCVNCPSGTTSAKGATSASECGICGKGSFTTTGKSSDCKKCPVGTYEDSRTSCKTCPVGSISGEGASECLRCPAGSIAFNKTLCLACPAGSRDVNRASCEVCPAGTFSKEGEADKCTACPAGYIAPYAGSTSCSTKCEPGFYGYSGLSCFQCAAGTFGIDGISCRQCPEMTISGPASMNCTQCSAGTTAAKGNTRCQDESGNEAGAQQPTTVVTSGGNAKPNNMFLYVFMIGVIGALLFVGVSIRNGKLERELAREDVRVSLMDAQKL